jgi:hypothetical protein
MLFLLGQIPVLCGLFWPLQGFCNFVIFIRPRYASVRAKYHGRSRLWAFYQVIWNPTGAVSQRTVPGSSGVAGSGSCGVSGLPMSVPSVKEEGNDTEDPSDALDHTGGHEDRQDVNEIPDGIMIDEDIQEPW